MHPRRPRRHRRKSDLMRAIQRHRLERIARGELQPRYDREFYFLWTLRARGRADPDDFILPGLLFMAEHAARLREEETAEAGAVPAAGLTPPAAPSPRPASPPPSRRSP